MSKITLSMIIKNEEKYLEDCLRSAVNVVDEIVIVDTGSTDRSLEIAAKYNARIFKFKWIDDFSAARNYALRHSTGDWILYLDADERLTKESESQIKKLTAGNKNLGINCIVNSIDEKSGTPSIMRYVRLFRNLPGVSFEGKVHEQIEASLKNSNCEIIDSEIEIIHLGYNLDEEDLKLKALRNLDLLLKDFKEKPNGYKAFHIGQSYVTLNKFEESIEYFLEAAEDPNLEKNHRAHACRYLSAIYLDHGSYDGAKAYLERGLQISENIILLNLVASKVYLGLGDTEKADYHCRKAYALNIEYLTKENKTHFDIMVDSFNLVLHGINVSLYSNNNELFSFFYAKPELSRLNNAQMNVLAFLELIINQKPIEKEFLLLLSETVREYNPNLWISLLNNYNNENGKHHVITELFKYFKDNSVYLNYYANFLLHIKNLEGAAEVFEKILTLEPEHTQAVMQLINLYTQTEDFPRLKIILTKAEILFADDKSVATRIAEIKTKLS